MLPDLVFITTALDQTDEQFAAQLRAVIEHARERPCDAVALVAGYDDDPRELWAIAEVRAHLRRLVAFGVPAVLVKSTGIRELCPPGLAGCPAFGGFEVWAHGHGLLSGGPNAVPDALVQTWLGTILPAAEESLRRNLERLAHVPADPRLLIEVRR